MFEKPYINNNQFLKKYDDLMVEVGSHLFEAECLLTTFVQEIVVLNDNGVIIEMAFSEEDEKCVDIIESLNWNNEKRCMEIIVRNNDNKYSVNWNDLPITTKNLIANFIHLNLLSDEIYNNLN